MITLLQQPTAFPPAYKPVEWVFASSKAPNTTPGEVDLPVFAIAIADAAAVTAIPGLSLGEVYVVLIAPPPPSFAVGQTISIQGSVEEGYNGTWRIVKTPQPGVLVIDAPPLPSTTTGTASLVYERYTLVVDIQFQNFEPKRYYLTADPNGLFTLDIRDQAQRSFADVFDLVNPDSPTSIIDATGAITALYSIAVLEGYMVPENGVPVFRIFDPEFVLPGDKLRRVVNSVQPYHHSDEFQGGVDLEWNDNLVDYIATNSTTGVRRKRFLTYAPAWDGNERGITVGSSEAYYLGFLTTERGPVRLTVQFYNGSTFLSETIVVGTWPASSGIIPIGPRNLPSVPPTADSYRVELRNPLNAPVTITHLFKIDRKCHKAPRRLYALNKFGAIDAFTFTGYEKRENTNERDIVQRPTMPAKVTVGGSFQRRTWRNSPVRLYSIISQTLTRAWLRYVADEILESADVRTDIHESRTDPPNAPLWTPVVLTNNSDVLGFEHGRLAIAYYLGVDNEVQRR